MQPVRKAIEYVGVNELNTMTGIEFEIKGLEHAMAQIQEIKISLEQTLMLIEIQSSEVNSEEIQSDK